MDIFQGGNLEKHNKSNGFPIFSQEILSDKVCSTPDLLNIFAEIISSKKIQPQIFVLNHFYKKTCFKPNIFHPRFVNEYCAQTIFSAKSFRAKYSFTNLGMKHIILKLLNLRNGFQKNILRLVSFHQFLQKLDESSLAETAEKTQGREDAIRFGKNTAACSNHAPPCASKWKGRQGSKWKGRQGWRKAITEKNYKSCIFCSTALV